MVESMLLLSADKLSITFLAIQQRINETYHVKIPKDTLRYLLGILESQGKVRILDGRTVIPTKEKITSDLIEIEQHRNAIEEFFLSFQQFLIAQGHDVALSEIRNQVCEWVYSHSSDLAEFIHRGRLSEDLPDSEDKAEWEYSSQFLSYLVKCRDEKTREYNSFIKLFDGAVQTSLLNFTPKQISEVSNPSFQIENVILDTNFLLRLLKLQAPIDNETAYDTWKQLQNNGTRFFALEQTIQEVSASIKGFLFETAPYSHQAREFLQNTEIRASGFFSALQNGMTRAEFFEWSKIETLRSGLHDSFSVEIIDDFQDSPQPEDILSLIQSKGLETYGEAQSKHDLLLIAYCRKKRSKRIKSFSDTRWWVLTNDKRLTYWNQLNCGEIQECITEVQLSNLLWIQDRKESNDGLSNTIVALASKFSIGSSDISRFAQQITRYKEKYAGNTEKLDSLALAFASGGLTTEDVCEGKLDEETFEGVISGKADSYRAEQKQAKEQLTESQKSNDEKERKIKELNKKLTLSNLTIEMRAAKKDKEDLEEDIQQAKIKLGQVNDIIQFSDSKTKPAARIVLLTFLIPLIVILILGTMYIGKPLVAQCLKTQSLDTLLNIIGCGVFSLILTVVYYVLVIIIFGTPHSPKELFLELRDRKIAKEKVKFVFEKGYETILAKENLMVQKKMFEESIKEGEKMLSAIIERIEEIQLKIETL